MRTALAALTLTVAGFVTDPDGAYAQEAGQLRVTVHLTDFKARMTYPAAVYLLTITAEGGSPIYRVQTGPDGMIERPLAPGVYVVESVNPTQFQSRYYRWSQRVVVTAGALTVLDLTNSNGQSTPMPSRTLGPLVGPFAEYSAPQRLTGGVTKLFPIGRIGGGEVSYGARGIELQASGGESGWRVAVGPFLAAVPIWTANVLLTVTRTTADPRGALPESTYVGVEAGVRTFIWTIRSKSCYHDNCRGVLLMFKPSIGVAHRVDGPAGQKRTMFTWSTGAQALSVRF